MRRTVFLGIGVGGLLVAIFLAGFLTVRRPPRLTQLQAAPGYVLAGPMIRLGTGAEARVLDLGWCAGVARPLVPGQRVTAWTDTDGFGRLRVWRVEQDTQVICRHTESTAALAAANRPLRALALGAAALGILALAARLLDVWRIAQRG
jgi:hypothetical protein